MGELASRGQLRMSLVRVALVIVPLTLFLGVVSAALSGSGYQNGWFAALAKPSIVPPGWVFGLAWTILYIMIGFALAIIVSARSAALRGVAIGLWIVQLACNLLWSPLFFAAHRIGPAFALILLMIALTIATILAFARIRRGAAWLMLPYLAWLCFAAYINQRVDAMNPGALRLAPAAGSTQVTL